MYMGNRVKLQTVYLPWANCFFIVHALSLRQENTISMHEVTLRQDNTVCSS